VAICKDCFHRCIGLTDDARNRFPGFCIVRNLYVVGDRVVRAPVYLYASKRCQGAEIQVNPLYTAGGADLFAVYRSGNHLSVSRIGRGRAAGIDDFIGKYTDNAVCNQLGGIVVIRGAGMPYSPSEGDIPLCGGSGSKADAEIRMTRLLKIIVAVSNIDNVFFVS
jgi:hypothetical protein